MENVVTPSVNKPSKFTTIPSIGELLVLKAFVDKQGNLVQHDEEICCHQAVSSGKKYLRRYIEKKIVFLISKRTVDIIVSSTVIILLLSWLTPIMAIFIKLNSRGPVFFVQRRTGRGLRSFGCIKFRTMIINEKADTCGSCENDIRITKIGKFLRKTCLDELPQFINVLIGDMSIVGPRPHMLADCARFTTYIPFYKFRHIVRPGITGLAQVKGFRGPANDSHSIISRFCYDSLYIQNLNPGMDISILLDTILQIFAILFKRNRQGDVFVRHS